MKYWLHFTPIPGGGTIIALAEKGQPGSGGAMPQARYSNLGAAISALNQAIPGIPPEKVTEGMCVLGTGGIWIIHDLELTDQQLSTLGFVR